MRKRRELRRVKIRTDHRRELDPRRGRYGRHTRQWADDVSAECRGVIEPTTAWLKNGAEVEDDRCACVSERWRRERIARRECHVQRDSSRRIGLDARREREESA